MMHQQPTLRRDVPLTCKQNLARESTSGWLFAFSPAMHAVRMYNVNMYDDEWMDANLCVYRSSSFWSLLFVYCVVFLLLLVLSQKLREYKITHQYCTIHISPPS